MAFVRRKGPTRHPFVGDPEDDDPTWQRCARCHLPNANAIHSLPQRTDEEREAEARRLGETDR